MFHCTKFQQNLRGSVKNVLKVKGINNITEYMLINYINKFNYIIYVNKINGNYVSKLYYN